MQKVEEMIEDIIMLNRSVDREIDVPIPVCPFSL